MVKKISINTLNKTKKYQRVVKCIKLNGSITALELVARTVTKNEASALLKYMYEIELLERKKNHDKVWVYTLPLELRTTKYEWE